MTDQELLEEFVRVSRYPEVIVIFAGTITWHGHTPTLKWIPVLALPEDTTADKERKAVSSVLKRKRFFSVCVECNERNPLGWMHDVDVCQSCAEKSHGVVY